MPSMIAPNYFVDSEITSTHIRNVVCFSVKYLSNIKIVSQFKLHVRTIVNNFVIKHSLNS